MLIAHSLGSIIAYDVLTLDASNVPIDTFVTIGSPLGLPIIKNRIVAEVKQNPSQKTILKTPENIRSHWYNLADLRDKISINDTLQDEFKENAIHIGPVDKIVTNDYAFDDQKKPTSRTAICARRKWPRLSTALLAVPIKNSFCSMKNFLLFFIKILQVFLNRR